MPIALTFDDLLEYTDWQRARWLTWLRDHPEALALSAGPNGDGRFTSVGDLVKHIFGAELRYVQRLRGAPLNDLATVPSDDVEALFNTGESSRRMLTDLIRDLDASVWDVPREFVILGYNVTATPKKIVMHVLIHEVRHWAQIATLCRLNGLVVEWQDFLGSPVWGGAFQSS
jgi:uncharacterized damage-inducible protein DinB